jgi:hypothetical protein
MANNLFVLAATCSILWVIRYLYRRGVAKSAIKHIPGPPSPSFITGAHTY